MSIQHTKSTSGCTHRLDVHGTVVTLRYHNPPAFDDQVLGDLIRKYWRAGGTVRPIGITGCRVDPDLDAEEIERRRLTPQEVAKAASNVAPWRPHAGHPGSSNHITEQDVEILIASAIKADRKAR